MKKKSIEKKTIECLADFQSAKIGKDLYPYLKRYYNDLHFDETNKKSSPNHSLFCRKLLYLVIMARNKQVPMLSELHVILKTLMRNNESYTFKTLYNELNQLYIFLVERVIKYTIQAEPVFASDERLNNPNIIFKYSKPPTPDVIYLIPILRSFVNRDNYFTFPLDSVDELFDELVKKDNRIAYMATYIPTLTMDDIPIDSDFEFDFESDMIDDSGCKDICFMRRTDSEKETLNLFPESNDFLTPEIKDKQEIDIPEEDRKILETIMSGLLKKQEDRLFAYVDQNISSLKQHNSSEIRELSNNQMAEIDAVMNSRLDAKFEKVVQYLTDYLSNVSFKIPFNHVLNKPDSGNGKYISNSHPE